MGELWHNNPLLANVTARRVMSMSAGIPRYNDTAFAQWTYAHANSDFSPLDMIHQINKSFVCKPGTCHLYSSTGYELLGLALAHLTNSSGWRDFDQLAVLPKKLLRNSTDASYKGDFCCCKSLHRR